MYLPFIIYSICLSHAFYVFVRFRCAFIYHIFCILSQVIYVSSVDHRLFRFMHCWYFPLLHLPLIMHSAFLVSCICWIVRFMYLPLVRCSAFSLHVISFMYFPFIMYSVFIVLCIVGIFVLCIFRTTFFQGSGFPKHGNFCIGNHSFRLVCFFGGSGLSISSPACCIM